MKNILNLFFLLTFSIFCAEHCIAQDITIDSIRKTNDPKLQLELALTMNWNKGFGSDTIQSPIELKKILNIDNKELKLAYHLLLADLYSVYFDKPNHRSDYYFQEARKDAIGINKKSLKAIVDIRQGTYYHTYRNTEKAFPYFLNASTWLNESKIEEIPLPGLHYQFIANFYAYLDYRNESNNFFFKSLPFAKPNTRERINMLTSIGLNYFNDKNYQKATVYFNQAKQDALSRKDSVWLGISNGYLSKIALINNNTNLALRLLKTNVYYSKKYNESLDHMRSLLSLAKLYIIEKKWDLAMGSIQEAQTYFEDKPYFVVYQAKAYKLLAQIASVKKDYIHENQYLNKYILYNESLQKQRDAALLQRLTWKLENQKYQSSLSSAEQKYNQEKLRYLIFAVILLLGFCIITLLIYQSRQKIKIRTIQLEKEQLQLKIEKQLIDDELVTVRHDMKDFIHKIAVNDQYISELKLKIEQAQKSENSINLEDQEHLNKMLQSHIMTDERWSEFKLSFNKLNPNFIKNLRTEFADISEHNLRLVILNELQLNNQSIANLLGISLAGVKKAKQRFRNKYSNNSLNL